MNRRGDMLKQKLPLFCVFRDVFLSFAWFMCVVFWPKLAVLFCFSGVDDSTMSIKMKHMNLGSLCASEIRYRARTEPLML